MCLIVIAQGAAPRYPLVVAANRDELHARATEAARWWPDAPDVFGGRDLVAGGTWLGMDRKGRIAAVTNVRAEGPREAPRSRGALVAEYLLGADTAPAYAERVSVAAGQYAPFNLLLVEAGRVLYSSNRAPPADFPAGVHALSNAPRGEDWPKTASARLGVTRLLDEAAPLEPLFALLASRDTREPFEERYRASHFLLGPVYGTRASTVVLVDADGNVTFAERSFDAAGEMTNEVRETFAL